MLDKIQTAVVKIFSANNSNGLHLTPVAALEINGTPFGTQTMQRIISVEMTDKRGFEADELTIELDDRDGAIAIPQIGDTIKLELGYLETGIVYKGEFLFAEFTHSGSPDTLSITARAADLSETLAEQKEKSWHKLNLYKIVETIAKQHGYKYTIGETYKKAYIAHIDQTNESDAAFLTRLADQYDAVATVKNSKLLFVPAGEAQTASGQPIPPLLLTRQSGDRHSFTYSAGNAYNAVRAYYTDKKTGKKKEVIVNKENLYPEKKAISQTHTYKRLRKDKKTGKITRSKTTTKQVEVKRKINLEGAKIKTLRHLYATEKGALSAARTNMHKLLRGAAEFTLTLAAGRPDIYPETPVTVKGFKQEIDTQNWLIAEVSHRLDDNGYSASLKLEAQLKETVVSETETNGQ